jgi:HK97 gp10 family phage protein
MAGKMSVKITRNRLPDIARILPEAANAIINERRGPEMRDVAKQFSRVDTGEMRDAWQWEATGAGTGQLVNDSDHVLYNEYGTVNMSAQPMARPALEQVGPEIVADFANLERLLA